ncbi:hypothetical protein TanjilG_31440 [Lupinus angustifolius]|uniref:C3H1-type domain-containing protein n=1 Tax=Lupinus angustifolius TaxID=3871 RepID=A0A4P1RTQ3_LUPAN|nr:PREDICTED: zinc finger CCCH domain-containing protein 43-like isoform X1 [Lupinus angustifolius]OIW18300.1 hypothetical protein TanjilG_31440 [Lupinus angustifolius]
MEHSESDSALVSNGSSVTDPQFDSQLAPSSLHSHHDRDPEPSDLSHVTQVEEDALGAELETKLDLKGEGEVGAETVDKVSNFGDGEHVCDEGEGGRGDDDGVVEVEESVKVNVNDGFGGNIRGWDCNSWDEDVNEGVNVNEGFNEYEVGGDDYVVNDGDWAQVEEKIRGRTQHYPLRPDAEDCAYYMKTGSCKFGFNCKFNHPIRTRNQSFKDKAAEREDSTERSGQTECKYYLRSGGCKFGKACKYNHTRGKYSAAPVSELNFLGLPIRLGERECPYYMRTGSCKYGATCKFNHPDPTTIGGPDSPSGYGNEGSISLQGVSKPSVSSWSPPRTLNETPFVPMLSPSQGVSPRSSDWNGYQAPMYLSDWSMHPPSAYVMSNPAIETNVYMQHQKQMPVDDFPERPGEPECSYFLKTGDCKFKSNCKFHHPKNRTARLPPCILSDKGLPLRPDQNICSHYSRYGICKFGPACRFDHPIDLQSTVIPAFDEQSYTNSPNVEVAGMGGSADASDVTIQQYV